MPTQRVNQILSEAEERLEYFYRSFGEWDGQGKPPEFKPKKRRKCKHSGCSRLVVKDSDYCIEHKSKPKNLVDIINEMDPTYKGPEKKIEAPVKNKPKPSKKPAPKGPAMFDGLNAKEIIKMVKEKVGKIIKVSVKSKKSVIKHAMRLLGERK
jgi:hypothetical protein